MEQNLVSESNISKNCKNCEEPFEPEYKQSKFCCSDCASEARVEYTKNYKAQRREELAQKQREYYEKVREKEEFIKVRQDWRNENKEYQRRYHLQRTYGITPEQYNELLEKQDHKCFICERPKEAFKKPLAVDHNHKTGEIRGLLCDHCNRFLIGRMTNPNIAYKMFEYLSQGTGWVVPKKKKKKPRKH